MPQHDVSISYTIGFLSVTEIYLNISLLFKNRSLGRKRSCSFFLKGPLAEPLILNESHSFDLPRGRLQEVCIMITFKEAASPFSDSDRGSTEDIFDLSDDEIGHITKHDVTLGTTMIGQMIQIPEAQVHWTEMLTATRTPIAHWHVIQ